MGICMKGRDWLKTNVRTFCPVLSDARRTENEKRFTKTISSAVALNTRPAGIRIHGCSKEE